MNKAKSIVKLRQVRSAIRRTKDQTDTLVGLKLNKLGKVSQLEDTPAVRGMINKVKHLLEILN